MKTEVNGLTMVHSEHYPIAMQMAKKFVAKEEIRPVLQYVYHAADGSIYATDSHHLLWIKNAHGFAEDLLIHPKTFMTAKGQYPNLDRVFPEKTTETVRFSRSELKEWVAAHKSLRAFAQHYEDPDEQKHVDLVFDNAGPVLTNRKRKAHIELPVNKYDNTHSGAIIRYNIDFMLAALECMQKMEITEEVKITFAGAMRPFVVDNEMNAVALILPVRIY